MTTPIYDFVQQYLGNAPARLHMPGHKGVGQLGVEALDITEIAGADSLYQANGIIAESESNASALFGCPTYYSTEGSSLCIRAMLYLVCLHAAAQHTEPLVWAGRNCHKTFIYAAAMLDFDVQWLVSDTPNYLSCPITAQQLQTQFDTAATLPTAVYLTDPDYLGHRVDIAAISAVCHRYNVLLVVDNAHGAYLRFASPSTHPMDLGADLCCDSAHKTLPVLTGGAYLHLSRVLPPLFFDHARRALALFGSTSPSYLILQSLDLCNRILSGDDQPPADSYLSQQARLVSSLSQCKQALRTAGFTLCGDEPLKLTIAPRSYGYTGNQLADHLAADHFVCEFADADHTVFMFTPHNGIACVAQLLHALCTLPRRTPLPQTILPLSMPKQVVSVRQALLSPTTTIPASQSVGHILASCDLSCPPAVPLAMPGERITPALAQAFAYYHIDTVSVLTD